MNTEKREIEIAIDKKLKAGLNNSKIASKSK